LKLGAAAAAAAAAGAAAVLLELLMGIVEKATPASIQCAIWSVIVQAANEP
jgi:hypothetical protein